MKNNGKIVVSGNPRYGLAQALRRKFPGAEFHSRSESGLDLTRAEASAQFATRSLGFDVYISCSCLHKFHQTLLLEEVYRGWREAGHTGLIVVMGSSADTPVKGTSRLYPIEKKALKAFARNLSMASVGGGGAEPSGIRICYLSVGHLGTPGAERNHPHASKLDCDYLADVIEWIISQPDRVNINEISIDAVQADHIKT